MVDPAHGALDESYTPEDDSQEVHSVFSDEGTARRQDNGVSDYKTITVRSSGFAYKGLCGSSSQNVTIFYCG